MSCELQVLAGRRVLMCDRRGDMVGSRVSADELVEEAIKAKARTIAIPHARLASSFLDWRSRLGQEFTRIFTAHGFRLVFIGDFTYAAGASPGLRDFMTKANLGHDVWFVRDLAELEARFAAERAGPAL